LAHAEIDLTGIEVKVTKNTDALWCC